MNKLTPEDRWRNFVLWNGLGKEPTITYQEIDDLRAQGNTVTVDKERKQVLVNDHMRFTLA
jgi:flagellar basal body rod protein FlgB